MDINIFLSNVYLLSQSQNYTVLVLMHRYAADISFKVLTYIT